MAPSTVTTLTSLKPLFDQFINIHFPATSSITRGGSVGGNDGISILFVVLIFFVLTFFCIKTSSTANKKEIFTQFIATLPDNDSISPIKTEALHFFDQINIQEPESLHDFLTKLENNPLFKDAKLDQYKIQFDNILFGDQESGVAGAPKKFDNPLFDEEKAKEYLTTLNVLYNTYNTNQSGSGKRKNCNQTNTKITNPITGRLIDSHGKSARALLHDFKIGNIKLSRQFVKTVKSALASHGL